MLHFDSDYMEGAHRLVMQRLLDTNLEQTTGYGSDPYTAHAKQLIREACCAPDADVHFLVGGTQTNSTVIDAILAHHEGVLASETSHINVHEAGAIEASGHKVLTLPSYDGKVKAADVRRFVTQFYADDTYQHMVAPGMVYISQPTELGTLYSLDELEEISNTCRELHIPLYADGARLGYGLTSPEADFTLPDMARLCDVFYIGGTKVGALFGEAVVAKPGVLKHFFPLVKQHGALLAKGRLLGIQFETLFTDGLYLTIARHAVEMAMQLKHGLELHGYRPFINSHTNQQFFTLPNEVIDRLMPHATFEYWGPRGETESKVRFVTSWATTQEAVTKLIEML